MTTDPFSPWLSMTLPSRLITLCKERGLSQQTMAEAIGIHANSWKKYESGQAQPSLNVLESLVMKYQARRWEAMRAAASAPAPKATGKSSAKRAAHACR